MRNPLPWLLSLALAGTLLPGSGTAQTGTYELFGFGCTGSGPGNCYGAALNGMGGALKIQTLPNEYAFPVKAPFDMTVVGFELFTRAASAAFNMGVGLYLEDPAKPGAPSFTPGTTGTMPVSTTLGFHSASLAAPVAVKKDQLFFISQMESTNVYPADLIAGDVPPGSIYWKRSTSTAWSTTGILKFPAYRIVIQGSGGTPMLGSAAVPTIGKPFSVDLSGARAGSPALLLLGLSKTGFLGLALPFDLTPFGATACRLLVSMDLAPVASTTASGTAALPLPLPNDPALLGAVFHNQWLVIDPAANPLNLVVSNGGTGKVGK